MSYRKYTLACKYVSVILFVILGCYLVVISGLYSIDGDRLSKSQEQLYDTDTYDYDTDNDGLSDSFEIVNGYDPHQKTIIVTVYYDESISKATKLQIQTLQTMFENAPVTNPDGTNGINLHLQYQKTNLPTTASFSTYDTSQLRTVGNGSYNIVLVDEVCLENNCIVRGVSNYYINTVFVERSGSYNTTRILLHELGHSIGLTSISFDGIDSKKYSDDEYPSVMNYNYTKLSYATQPHNDWNKISRSIHYRTNDKLNEPAIITLYKHAQYIKIIVIDFIQQLQNIQKLQQLTTQTIYSVLTTPLLVNGYKIQVYIY